MGVFAAATAPSLPSERNRTQECTASCYPQTGAESKAAAAWAALKPSRPYPRLITAFPPGNVERYGALGDETTDDWLAIQAAIDGCSSYVYFPSGTYLISRSLIIGADTLQNLAFIGENRTNTYLAPRSADLSAAGPDGINALIVNKNDNGKFSVSNLRFWSGVTYTGIAIFAETGGGAKRDCKVIFSGSIDNCWCDLSDYNGGFFRGGLNNYRVSNMVFEKSRGAFKFTSTTSDVHFSNISLFRCWNFFVQQSTSTGSNVMSVNGLHAYSHNQGVLFELTRCTAWGIHDVILQAALDKYYVGGVGLFKFDNCRAILVDGFQCYANAEFGTGPLATQIALTATDANFNNGKMEGCDVGIRVQGAGSNDLSFNEVHCINSRKAALQVVSTAGVPGGVVRASDCNWSDGQYSLVTFSNLAAIDLHLHGCRLVNAGSGGDSAARNLAPASSGLVVCSDCVIGRNNPAAVAEYYIDGAGTGPFILRDTTFVGTPPTAVQCVGATQIANAGPPVTAVPFAPRMTFDAAGSDRFVITPTSNATFIINAPASPMIGKRITVVIRNSTGALGGVTWNAVFKLAKWTQPMKGASRSIDFSFDGTHWVEASRTPMDVPL